jgi:serine/threonine protein kinase
MEQYKCFSLLGRGHSANVYLARGSGQTRLVAIKERRKQKVIDLDEAANLQREVEALQTLNKSDHPFLINLVDVFQTTDAVYLVEDFASGGDLDFHIGKKPFTAEQTRFYAAELCLAIKDLHEHDIIHRNIKLENILLAADGHIVLAGFGTCKPETTDDSSTREFVGGGNFMAPEVLRDQGYGRPADWWAFGIALYQMLLREDPFKGDDLDEVYDAILSDAEPNYPDSLPEKSFDILRGLLVRDPRQRLGSGEAGAVRIMQHPFFGGISWDDVAEKKIEPSFIPMRNDESDLCNFDLEFTKDQKNLPQLEGQASPLTANDLFRDFNTHH